MLRQAVDADGDSFKFQGLSVRSTNGNALYFAGSWDRAHLSHPPALNRTAAASFQDPVPKFWYQQGGPGPLLAGSQLDLQTKR